MQTSSNSVSLEELKEEIKYLDVNEITTGLFYIIQRLDIIQSTVDYDEKLSRLDIAVNNYFDVLRECVYIDWTSMKDIVLAETVFRMQFALVAQCPEEDYDDFMAYESIMDNAIAVFGKEAVLGFFNSEKHRFSVTEEELINKRFSFLPYIFEYDEPDLEKNSDVIEDVLSILACAYWNMMDRKAPEMTRTYTNKYVDAIKDLKLGRYKKLDLSEDGYHLSFIYSIVFSPESIAVIFNSYRISEKEEKERKAIFFLKVCYCQLRFILDSEIFENYSWLDDKSEKELVEMICDDVHNYIQREKHDLDDTITMPSIPFYNFHYFWIRLNPDVSDEHYIKFSDMLNSTYVKGRSGFMFDLFADEVEAAAEYKTNSLGYEKNSRFNDALYQKIEQLGLIMKEDPDTVTQISDGSFQIKTDTVDRDSIWDFQNEYKKNEEYDSIKERYVREIIKCYNIGIFLRTFYRITDIKWGFPNALRKNRDDLQSLLYNAVDYGTVGEIIEDSNSLHLELDDEIYYSGLKDELIMDLKNKLEECYSVDDLLKSDIRSSMTARALINGNRGYFVEIVENLNDIIMQKLEDWVHVIPGFKDCTTKIKNELMEKSKGLTDKIHHYMNGNLKVDYAGIIKSLSTAEFLYDKYIIDNTENPDIDYSFIAIEYYTSLEALVNLCFYIPYMKKVLTAHISDENKTSSDKKKNGYYGDCAPNRLYKKGHFNESLELGTISFLYKKLQSGPDEKYSELREYIKALGLEEDEVERFFKKISQISTLRNNAAHGGMRLSLVDAKKAQDVTVRHELPDTDVDKIRLAKNIHDTIGTIFDMFNY